MDEQEKPSKKIVSRGVEALTDAELVSVILAVPMARAESIVKDATQEAYAKPREKALAEYAKRRRAFNPRPVIDGGNYPLTT